MQLPAKCAVPLLLCLLAVPASALPPPWTPLGPYGGDVRALTVDPRQPASLYAVTAGGAFKTTDRGVSWSALNLRGDAGGVAADPAHPGVLYLAVRIEGVIKSTDGGAHWSPANGGLPFQNVTPRAVAVDPARPERLYLITSPSGLWRSTNGGVSWLSAGPAGARSIAISPAAGTAFLSASSGVYRTVDAGATWKPLAHGLSAGPAGALAVSASDPRTVYAYFNAAGLFRSQDGGTSWQHQRTPLPGGGLVAFAVSPRTPRLLYLSLSNGSFYRSLDGGVLWSGLSGISDVKALAGAEPRMSGTVYAGTGLAGGTLGGVWRSEDAGTTWTQRNQGLSGIPVTEVAVDPSQPDHLWAAIEGRVYRSFNRGAQWLAASPLPGNPPAANVVRSLAVGASSQVFAAALQALWKSSDAGASWTLAFAPPGISSFVRLLAVASPASAGLYLEAQDQGVYRSTDGGASWQPEGDPGLVCGAGDLEVAPASPEVLYAGGSGKSPAPYLCKPALSPRVARSDDGGATWTDVSAGLPGEFISALAVDPRDPRIVYAGSGPGSALLSDGVWKSTDGGGTWVRAGAELADQTITSLLASNLSGRIYAVVDGTRVFRSDDGGASWQGWSRGLHGTPILILAADPTDPRRIYAATANGVWALTETD